MTKHLQRVVLVAVAVVAGTLLLRQAGVDTEIRLAGAAKAAWSGGVVHARFLTPEGDLMAEEWVDLETGASRKVERGMGEALDYTVQNGMTIVHWTSTDPSFVYRAEVVDRNDPWLQHASQLLGVQRALDAGRARISGSAMVDGTPAWAAKLTGGFGDDAPADADVTAYLDQQTYELRRLAYTTGGVTRAVSVQSERLDQAEARRARSKLFAVDPGATPAAPERGRAAAAVPAEWTLLDRRLDARALRAVAGFRVYTLGPAYRGLRLSAPLLRLAKGAFDVPFEPTPHLAFGYAERPFAEPAIDLTQRAAAADQSQRELAAFVGQGEVRSATVAGRRRDVHLLDADARPVYFALVVDGTLISGRANFGAAETLTMLESLEVLG